jgi:3-methyladenine DNA glycosylase AlkD
MTSATEVLKQLKSKASLANLAGMARYGMTVEKRLGVSVPDMRRIAKGIGQDHKLAARLWKTGLAECKIVASMIADPAEITAPDMDAWVLGFDSWDICDQVCMNLFEKTPFAQQKIAEWSQREEEFVRRAGFTLIADLAWHAKQAPNEDFIRCLPLIKQGAADERNFVKKAVNWALRTIGKRNLALNRAAIRTAKEIARLDSKAAQWVAADALRELEGAEVQKRLLSRH